jgi:hypothetical protein
MYYCTTCACLRMSRTERSAMVLRPVQPDQIPDKMDIFSVGSNHNIDKIKKYLKRPKRVPKQLTQKYLKIVLERTVSSSEVKKLIQSNFSFSPYTTNKHRFPH